MGNTTTIKNYINNVNPNIKLRLEEIKLHQLCDYIEENKEIFYIEKKELKNILCNLEEKKCDRIFQIFGEINEKKEDIISFESLKYLYYAFTDDNPKIKFILLSFLLFGNKEFMEEKELNINIHYFLNSVEKLYILFVNYSILCSRSLKSNQIIIQRHDFINSGENSEILEYLKEYHFIRQIVGTSKFKLNNKNKSILEYYCDCDKNKTPTNIDSMKQNDTKIIKIYEFKEILEKNKIENNFIKIIIDHLKKVTLKEYFFYKDLKYLFNNLDLSLPIDIKKKFLFEIISNIYNNTNVLNFDEKFINIDLSLEKFGLIPYLEFGIKTDNKKIKKKIINEIFINNSYYNYEKYLENQFEDCDYFYAIDINFWNKLLNDNDEIPDYINNSRIAEEIVIIKEEDRYKKIEEERIKKYFKNDYNNKKNNNKIEIIEAKYAKLKKGMKYKIDFVIICGQLFNFFKNNFQIDYIIKFKKFQELIENEQITNKEFIMKEKLIKEKLNKFIIDVDKGYISKIVSYNNYLNGNKEENNESKYVLNELDFYPVQVYTKTFGVIVREVEKAKLRYEELEKNRKYNELSEKEKERIAEQKNQKNREYQILHDKIEKYNEHKLKLQNKLLCQIISKEEYDMKYTELKKQYSCIFQEREKTIYDYEVDISMSEFIDTLAIYKNDILVDNDKNVFLRQRYKTYRDIKRKLFKDNHKILDGKIFKIYYFYFRTKTLFIPDDDFSFENDVISLEPFVCIIVDIYNEKGENFYDLLIKKEEEKNKMKSNSKITKLGALKIPNDKEKIIISEEERKKKELFNEKLETKEIKDENQNNEIKKNAKKNIQIYKIKEKEAYISPPYGINNFGNTCYLNSVIQILLNIPLLKKIFLDDKIDFFINQNNDLKIQKEIFEMFKSLFWLRKSENCTYCFNLKKIIR